MMLFYIFILIDNKSILSFTLFNNDLKICLYSFILSFFWPKIVKNEEVYEKTKIEPWSKTIEKKRIKWFGHLMRLDENTPAQKALRIALM